MKILFAASEAAPYIKSGGLGDVAAALPRELAKIRDNKVSVFVPYYRNIKKNFASDVQFVTSFSVPLAWRNLYAGVFKINPRKNLTVYFIDNECYFDRDLIYGYPDDGERFAFFCKAVLESLQYLGIRADIIHANDWQTGFIPLFLKAFYTHINAKTVFTIHNIEYQGKADPDFLGYVLGVDPFWRQYAEFNSLINALKCAITLSDKVTTVSKTYSHEIRYAYFAHGLEKILSYNSHKLCGIVNGIDTKLYDPETDKNLASNYSPLDLSGKKICKTSLQERLSLPKSAETPVITVISRLVEHKGMELIEYIGEEMINTLDIQLAVLGTGDERFENYFKYLAYKYPHRVSANIFFDSRLASEIYAGADLLLMPSKSEPCGLSQLIAMRYGTIPIVRETGGLVDTVPPVNPETLEGRGITFKVFNAHDMYNAVQRGASLVRDRQKSEKVIQKIMRFDSGWEKPAAEYMNLYYELTEEKCK